jgi:hypothetical protein
MQQTKKQMNLLLFAGIALALSVVSSFLYLVIDIARMAIYGWNFNVTWIFSTVMMVIFQFLPLAALAVMCLIKKRNVLALVPVGMLAFYSFFMLIRTLTNLSYIGNLFYILYNLLFVAACIILALNILSQTVKGLQSLSKILGFALIGALALGTIIFILYEMVYLIIFWINIDFDMYMFDIGNILWYFGMIFNWWAIILTAVGLVLFNFGFSQKKEVLNNETTVQETVVKIEPVQETVEQAEPVQETTVAQE